MASIASDLPFPETPDSGAPTPGAVAAADAPIASACEAVADTPPDLPVAVDSATVDTAGGVRTGEEHEAAPAGAGADADADAAAPSTAAPVAVRADSLGPAQVAQALKERFPALFTGAPKPLKLRIQVDIQERAPGVFSRQALSTFFRRYTGGHGYLVAITRAPHRFDLDGQPAGEISDEHRQIAADELARRRTLHASRQAEEQGQRERRAQLLRDFERTTLSRANFCSLKGVEDGALDALLEQARREAAEAPLRAPDRRDHRAGARPGGPARPHPEARGPREGRPAGARPEGPRGDGPRREGGRPRGGPGRPR